MAANSMEIIVGSYEELILGYKLTKNGDAYSLEQSFTNHSHMGSVRSVCANSTYLATGSSDEVINLFNLKTRVECGSLVHHEGTINCLKFFGDKYLLSGSEDGNVCVWQTKNWQCLKTLKGHKKGVVYISIHPMGNLALSVSKDATLRTWNLIKGRSAYVTNIKKVANLVEWSTTGNFFAVVIDHKVDIYSVQKAGIVRSIDYGKNIYSLIFINDDTIAIGGEKGSIEIHSTLKDKIWCQFDAHSNRIRGMTLIENEEKSKLLVTASSDSFIKVWLLDTENLEAKPKLLTKFDVGCRITSLTVSVEKSKVKKDADEIVEVKEEESINKVTVPVKRKKKQKETSKKKKNKFTVTELL